MQTDADQENEDKDQYKVMKIPCIPHEIFVNKARIMYELFWNIG